MPRRSKSSRIFSSPRARYRPPLPSGPQQGRGTDPRYHLDHNRGAVQTPVTIWTTTGARYRPPLSSGPQQGRGTDPRYHLGHNKGTVQTPITIWTTTGARYRPPLPFRPQGRGTDPRYHLDHNNGYGVEWAFVPDLYSTPACPITIQYKAISVHKTLVDIKSSLNDCDRIRLWQLGESGYKGR